MASSTESRWSITVYKRGESERAEDCGVAEICLIEPAGSKMSLAEIKQSAKKYLKPGEKLGGVNFGWPIGWSTDLKVGRNEF
jgi:hypothetical protein